MAQGAVHPGELTPATAATPRTGPASPDPARGRLPVTPRELGFTPFRDPPPPPAPQEGALPKSPEGIRDPGWKPSKPVPETEDVRTPESLLDIDNTLEALAPEAFIDEQHAQIPVNADLNQGNPPAKAAIRPSNACDSPPLEGSLPDSSEETQTPEWKPYAGSQAVPDTEGVRTPVSSLKSTCEALAHEAFTDEQHAQLYAHILITADLNQGKPPSKAAMVLAFGQPVEGQKHAWEEVWRAALDRYQSQMSPMGCETPFSSQNGPLEPSPNSMENLEEFQLKETHSELVDTQTSQWQNQKSPMTGFETPNKSVIDNCTAQGLDVQNGGEIQLAVSCADKVDQELPDDSKDLIKNVQTLLEPLSCSTPLESSESLTEQDSCVKCGKDGQLLKCCSCFLGAHASCLGSSVTFDDSGHFDCPVCLCRKAAKALEKAKKTYFEARKNLSVFCSSWKQFTKEHIEQSTGKQQRAANFEDQMNGCRTAKKQGYHQSEAAEQSRKGEEPSHLKGNGTNDASPEKEATTNTAVCPIPENAKSHGDSNSSLSPEVPYSSRVRFSSVANRSIGVGKENYLMNFPHCNFSDRPGAISTRNMSRKVRFQETGTVAPNSSWKTLRYQDQSVHSPARKRYYPYPPEYYYSPCTPAMRTPLVPSKTPFTSTTARRKVIFWTEAEEVALMEAVAKFAPKGEAANEKRTISWVRIHEYGRESFHPTRCPDDLRKKWNRMKNKLGCPETCPPHIAIVLGEREGK